MALPGASGFLRAETQPAEFSACLLTSVAHTLGLCMADSPRVLFKGIPQLKILGTTGVDDSQGLRQFWGAAALWRSHLLSGFVFNQNPLLIKVSTQRTYSTRIFTLSNAVDDLGKCKRWSGSLFLCLVLRPTIISRGRRTFKIVECTHMQMCVFSIMFKCS